MQQNASKSGILASALTYNQVMTFQVQRIGDHYGVLFTEEQMRLVGLTEGTQVDVEVHKQQDGAGVTFDPPASSVEHVSLEEGIAAYRATEPRWSDVYRELAK